MTFVPSAPPRAFQGQSVRPVPPRSNGARAGGTSSSHDVLPSPYETTLHPHDFSDVSAYEPGADWDKYVQTGRPMAVCRATKGVHLVDPTVADYRQGLSERGLYCGLYHFAGWPSTQVIQSPEEEAKFFLDAVGTLGPKEFPILDFEQDYKMSPDQQVNWMTRFCTAVEQKTGKTPWIYSGYNMAKQWHAPQLSRYPLWIADYSVAQPPTTSQWPKPIAWQYTESASVPGIGTPDHVDDSHFYGDLSTLGQPADGT